MMRFRREVIRVAEYLEPPLGWDRERIQWAVSDVVEPSLREFG